MGKQFQTEIITLTAIAKDSTRSQDERIAAARDCSWLIASSGIGEPTITLARAVLSRVVDGCKDNARATAQFSDFGYWRRFPLTGENKLNTADDLRQDTALTCAQLLWDGGRHPEAVAFFDRVLQGQPTAAAVILACWNMEVLSRQGESLQLVERAIDLLTLKFKRLLADPQYEAEVAHLSGHLTLLRGRFSKNESLGYEKLGVQRLAYAASLWSAYSACYASSFAEYGDFLASVEACLELIRSRPFDDLPKRDAQIVELEILFYLAYCLMAAGEIERARMCFRTFSSVSGQLGLNEARDHARLFLVKLDLKGRSLLDLHTYELEKAYADLRSLSFAATLSLPVGEECFRYEMILQLLLALTQYRGMPQILDSDIQQLGQRSVEILKQLQLARSGILDGIQVRVGPANRHPDAVDTVIACIHKRTAGIGALPIERYAALDIPNFRIEEALNSILMWGVVELQQEAAATMATDIIPFAASDSLVGSVPQVETAVDLLLLSLAVIAIKRFWAEDRYVFGLVPCLESPATKFQHPDYDIRTVF